MVSGGRGDRRPGSRLCEAEPGSDQVHAIDEASAHLGFPWLLQLAFDHEGGGHYFWQEVSWHESLVRRVRQIVDESAVVDEAEAEVKMDTWARILASDPAFQRAGTRMPGWRSRVHSCPTSLPDLDPSGRDGRALAERRCPGLAHLPRGEILPRQEADTARRARELLAEGVAQGGDGRTARNEP
jgi:hypothetical protein